MAESNGAQRASHNDTALAIDLGRSSSPSSQHELPLLAPLSHDHPLLRSSEPFDVDEFLLSRPNMSLHDLRFELRSFLGELKEELVQLINDDYAAFISLSTDLRGEGARLERLHWPLGNLKGEVERSRSELLDVQAAVQKKLVERAALREKKALLQLLMKLSDSVVRLESLLTIASPQDSVAGASMSSTDLTGVAMRDGGGLNIGLQLGGADDDNRDDRSRPGQAKHLSRVAAEYTQLLYHAEKGRSEKCAFVQEIQWRIDRIKSTLSRDLDHLFSHTLLSLTSTSVENASTADKARWMADLTECLRTYDVLRSWRDAEEVVRRDLVLPFVKNTIFYGALNVAQAPVLVRAGLENARSAPMSPRTPFTSFLGGKSNPFDNVGVASLPLVPDEEGNVLAGLYNTILRFVQVNCLGVMEIAEKVSAKSRRDNMKSLTLTGLTPLTLTKEPAEPSSEEFDILGNVVWTEIGRSIMDELGSVVFAAGRPADFQKNYVATDNFITALEHMAPSLHCVSKMRAHPVYVSFQRRWQLPVYFQLRWKEIVGRLEDLLSVVVVSSQMEEGFATQHASAVFQAINSCWSSEVYIPELGHRFWRLTLQLLSRYQGFLEESLPKPVIAENTLPADLTNPDPRASVTGSSVQESSAADEYNLKLLANAIADIQNLNKRVMELWVREIGMLVPETSQDSDQSLSSQDVLKEALEHLTALVPDLSSSIVQILIRKCVETLGLVRSIPSQYRAMNRRRDPTEPSYFIAGILQPVRHFLSRGGPGEPLSAEYGQEWKIAVFDAVANRYTSYLTAMKKNEDSLRRFKNSKKSAFSLFGGGSSRDDQEGRDEERVRAQMILDVEALGNDAQAMGVDVENNDAFKTLKLTTIQLGE